MKIEDLYINPKNVCTIGLYMEWKTQNYGLQINGAKFSMGVYKDGEEKKAIKKLRKCQQMIIDEVERTV